MRTLVRFFDKLKHTPILALGIGLALTILLIGLSAWNHPAYAQGTSTPATTPATSATTSATRLASRTPTPRRTGSVTATATVSPTATLTVTQATTRTPTADETSTSTGSSIPVTVTVVVTVTSVATPTLATASPTATPSPTAGPPVVALQETEVLTGTILANRTGVTTTFFLEGQLYVLAPLRSTGVVLARPLTALTLYNCEANTGASESDCFWDPYPVRQDGFYEIVNGAEADTALNLILEEAAPPPTDQIWIQNRTGHIERFLYAGDLYELENSHVLELPLAATAVEENDNALVDEIYLRRCLGLEDRSVCEWLPAPVLGGVYYALSDETEAGLLPNSAITQIKLDLVLGEERLAALATPTPEPTPEPISEPAEETASEIAVTDAIFCQIQVPTLNVRSGPGLEYLVVGQINQADPSGGRVQVVGRNATNEWLAIDETLVPGGWVVNSPQFVICESGTEPLVVARVTDGRLGEATPTPAPVAAVTEVEAGAEDAETSAEEGPDEAEEEPAEAGIPTGRALLVATNTFEHDIRFTISAEDHDLPEGSPSEYDLQPDQSVTFLIRPGRVQFSASTPFRGGAGNAEFFLDEGAARSLFLRFVPPVSGDGDWELQWE